jgi:predicted RNA-binding Zn-ribbon protein involved in translation (DUF1610 family)
MAGVLYRAFASDGALLYIGATVAPSPRLSQHGYNTAWWSEVATVTLEHFAERAEAFAAERAAIEAEQPRYNVAHQPAARVLSESEAGRRREARRERRERAEAERTEFNRATYGCAGVYVCPNCRHEPARATKGRTLADLVCPHCGVQGLELVVKAAA